MRGNKPLPQNVPKNVDPIIAALSEDTEKRLDEISSVIVVAEAGDDFPHFTVEKIIGLKADKRAMLKEVVSCCCFYLC